MNQPPSERLGASHLTAILPPDGALNDAFVAALEIAAEIDVPIILQRIVNLARKVVPSSYAALGVANEHGVLTQFITSGISAATRSAIGPLPQGHGLLGTLIQHREPLLVDDIASDPRSIGFPPNHPPMHSLIGIPIMLGNVVLGNLYLTEREHGTQYTKEDLAALRVLAAHAATTIERAQLLELAQSARQSAEEQRDQLETILNSMPSAVLILRSADAQVELANGAARAMLLMGRSRYMRGDLPQPARDYRLLRMDGTELPIAHWPGTRALGGEVVRNKQLTLKRSYDHTLIPVLMQAAPLRDSTGAIRRAVLILQDITQLREAEQLKDDFLSLVSHEMRTPLTAIHGGANLLANQGNQLDESTRQEILQDIVTESTRLEQTLANILTLTGIQAGRLEPTTEPVLLSRFLPLVMSQLTSLMVKHHLRLTVADNLPAAEGDPELLGHVMRNLIENAAKYSADGTSITIHAGLAEDGIVIQVVDEGSGIAPEHLPHVFERFRRPGADPSVRGMGIGLYLSQNLMHAQGGTLTVESDGPGKGARFSILLPIATGWDQSAPNEDETYSETEA